MNFLFLESSRNWGGQEYRTCLEINWLNANGHSAKLLADPDSDVYAKARAIGTLVEPINFKQRFNPRVSFALWRRCCSCNIDVVKCYSSKDHWLALPLYWSGIPLVRTRSITSSIGGATRAFIFKQGCSRIVVDASVIRRQLVEQNGIAPEKIEVVGSAVDLEKFNPRNDGKKFREEFGIAPEQPLIVNVGMIRADKGQTQLATAAIDVLREFPNARFMFVGKAAGSGKQEVKLRDIINSAGIADKVLLAGYRWNTPEILAAADIVVISSTGVEASPIVLREAFATGRALVATTVGDIPEVIRDGENGLLVEPRSPEALASAIKRFLRDDDLRKRCAENALQYAQQYFAFEQMIRAKLRVDEQAVAQRR